MAGVINNQRGVPPTRYGRLVNCDSKYLLNVHSADLENLHFVARDKKATWKKVHRFSRFYHNHILIHSPGPRNLPTDVPHPIPRPLSSCPGLDGLLTRAPSTLKAEILGRVKVFPTMETTTTTYSIDEPLAGVVHPQHTAPLAFI